MKMFVAALATATATALGSSMALAQNPMVGGAEMFPDRNIVENAMNSADHTTLVAAVQAAGMADTLMGEGPFTVLAPTNEAFAMLPEGAVDDLLKPENVEQLRTVLGCHVIPAAAFSNDISQMIQNDGGSHLVQTVGGCTLTLLQSVNTGPIEIRDENGTLATVTQADVAQSNGVIHVIDHVLMPAM